MPAIPYFSRFLVAQVNPIGMLTLSALEASPLPTRFSDPGAAQDHGFHAFHASDGSFRVFSDATDHATLSYYEGSQKVHIVDPLVSPLSLPGWNGGTLCTMGKNWLDFEIRSRSHEGADFLQQRLELQVSCDVAAKTAAFSLSWRETNHERNWMARMANKVLVSSRRAKEFEQSGPPDLQAKELELLNKHLGYLPDRANYGIPLIATAPLTVEQQRAVTTAYSSNDEDSDELSRIQLAGTITGYLANLNLMEDELPVDIYWEWQLGKELRLLPGAREFCVNLAGKVPSCIKRSPMGEQGKFVLDRPWLFEAEGKAAWSCYLAGDLIRAARRLHMYHILTYSRYVSQLSNLMERVPYDDEIGVSGLFPNSIYGW